MQATTSRLAATFAAIALSLGAGAAHANGRFPASQFVVLGPGERAERIALRTTFGVVSSLDSGRSWSWHCEEFFDYSKGAPWDPPIAWGGASAGTPLFVGLPDGLSRTRDLCASARIPEAMRDFTGDVTASVDGDTVYWVASNGTGRNRVLVSNDGGATFSTRGSVADGVLPITIEAAGVGARRVYITAVSVETSRAMFFRSDDGGARIDELPLDLRGGRDAYLAGVDRTNPDVVYLRSSLIGTSEGLPGGTLLLRSADGGRSFDEVARSAGPMLGFALSGDGRTIWIGGPDDADRLRRSDDGGRTFARVSDVRVLCLRWHAGALYVCAPYVTEGFALGRSTDGGGRIEPLLRLQTLAGPPASCAPSSASSTVCAPRWPALRALIAPDETSVDAGARLDASALAPRDVGGDCGCRARRGDRRWTGMLAALAVMALSLRARVRDTRRRP